MKSFSNYILELRDKKIKLVDKTFDEEKSIEMQMKNISRKKKEAAMDQNDLAKKGSSPVKG